MSQGNNSIGHEDDLGGPVVVLLLAGVFVGFSAWNGPFDGVAADVWWVVLGASALGFAYVVRGFHSVFRTDGLGAAFVWLFTPQTTRSGTPRVSSDTAASPPSAPAGLETELFDERANGACEWCGDRIDSATVRQITPNTDGGQADPQNLIVLCPDCERKADGGTLSRSTLEQRVGERMDRWRGSLRN
jgi:hypothetical protein